MKSYLVKVLAGITAGFIIFFATVYVNKEKPNVRFSLLGGIPAELLGETSAENVQMLEVFNSGKEEAKQLRIRINRPLTYYKLKQYSEADKAQVFPSEKGLEIAYPSLPPQGSLKVFLKSKAMIDKSNIDINHSKGKGQEAFEEGSSNYGKYSVISFFLLYLFFILFIVRNLIRDNFKTQSKYDSIKLLSRKRRPLFLSERSWKVFRSQALEKRMSRDDYESTIEKTESYKILCLSDNPDYLTEEDWLSVREKAIENVSKLLIKKLNTAYHDTDVLNLLGVAKPSLFPTKKWDELQEKINKGYLISLKREKYYWHSEVKMLITQKKPDGVIESFWNTHIEELKKEFFKLLSQELEQALEPPLEFLSKQAIDVLSKEKVALLKKRAYQLQMSRVPDVLEVRSAKAFIENKRPEWMLDDDYNKINGLAKRVIKLDIMSRFLWDIVWRKALPEERPDIIEEDEWNRLANLGLEFKKIEEDHKSYEEDHRKVQRELAEVVKLKDTIERQLYIIQGVLSDPKSIERIEEYSNVFAPGNFENLKKIGILLSKREG